MATAIFSGALANKPLNGGNAWSRLSWLLGFKRLDSKCCSSTKSAAIAAV